MSRLKWVGFVCIAIPLQHTVAVCKVTETWNIPSGNKRLAVCFLQWYTVKSLSIFRIQFHHTCSVESDLLWSLVHNVATTVVFTTLIHCLLFMSNVRTDSHGHGCNSLSMVAMSAWTDSHILSFSEVLQTNGARLRVETEHNAITWKQSSTYSVMQQ